MLISIGSSVLIALIIVGTWIHTKTIEVEVKYDTYEPVKGIQNIYEVGIYEKKLGIFKSYTTMTRKYVKGDRRKRELIRKYKKKV